MPHATVAVPEEQMTVELVDVAICREDVHEVVDVDVRVDKVVNVVVVSQEVEYDVVRALVVSAAALTGGAVK